MMSDRVKQILGWYESDNPGSLANLRRMLGTGTLADTGKMVILPVDQGFEHGPPAQLRQIRPRTTRTITLNWPWKRAATPTPLRWASSKPGPALSPASCR